MFFVSKVLAPLTQPLLWVAMLLLIGLLVQIRWPRAGRRAIWAAWALMLLLGWMAPSEWVIRQLEGQYAEFTPQADLSDYVGVVVLGGATESGRVQQAHAQPLFNGAAERITAPLAMLRHNPQLRVLYTGGEGALRGSGPSEADRARVFYESVGWSSGQVQYESASRNTYENAALSAQLPGVDKRKRWLLVTSAAHMPRSMGTFVKAGWNVTAYPVDFHTSQTSDWLDFNLASGAVNWEAALHELLGLMAYRLAGRL
ncbi:YdcF family protein [Rhodoferax sp.]|uniref:YdcF family protein n=1 Tax=Rhodoferax sp. TaxID=50421 RepID=UPI002ACE4B01|nr:YdcF family protein [Rhodoferax sp.]MDZ7919835.1 YdcF family protein [Rhodoferax sp.]